MSKKYKKKGVATGTVVVDAQVFDGTNHRDVAVMMGATWYPGRGTHAVYADPVTDRLLVPAGGVLVATPPGNWVTAVEGTYEVLDPATFNASYEPM